MIEPTQVEALLDEALPKSPAERATFLDRACEGNRELRQEVERLLAAHPQAEGFLDRPVLHGTAVHGSHAEVSGTIIGPYKLLEQIGEGGMGAVWMAQQQEPVKRVVALKVIKAGMDSKQLIARFEAERQALALMDHPNIAKVLDADTTSAGRPYFVMDLVKGVPITRYCDEHHFTPRQRLELFIPVCQAVQHAHQKGIIHRDLKPSNVLVALYDGKPAPKVIDFGVAKAAGQELTDKTLVTGFGSIVGTLEYMSPEQAEVNQLDIDTRSDIYSLGVLLYELLTGTPPFTRKELKKAGMLEMLRVIREQEPSKPSIKLSTAEGLPTLAANRGTEPAKLTRLVRGELDWIVMKALEKDRNRRYETANGFAMDVQRYLADEPVLAGPPTAAYRLRKFIRRNRGVVFAAALLMLTLLLGILGTTVGLVAAEEARQAEADERIRAEEERDDKERARQAAADSERRALKAAAAEKLASEQAKLAWQKEVQERKYAKAIADFVNHDFLALTTVEGQIRFAGGDVTRLDKDTTLRQLLDRAATKLNERKDLDPRTEADLRLMIGGHYLYGGEAELAVPLFEHCLKLRKEVFGPHAEETLRSQNGVAIALLQSEKLDQALPLLEETLKLTRTHLGPRHVDTLVSLGNLALGYLDAAKFDLALPLLEETLKLRKAEEGPDHLDTLMTMGNLALAYDEAGRLDLALPLWEETLKRAKEALGADDTYTHTCMNNLGEGYRKASSLNLALPLLEKTLKLRTAKLGAHHPDTLMSMNNLATAYREDEKLELALPLLQTALKLMEAKLGAHHSKTCTIRNNLAACYQDEGKHALAISLFEENLRLRKARRGADHPRTLISMANLADAYHAAGMPKRALPLLEKCLKLMEEKLGPNHPHTLAIMNDLAAGYRDAGMFKLALPLFEETLKLAKVHLGADHPDTLKTMDNLAQAYRAAGALERALPLCEEILKLRMVKPGPRHPNTLASMNNLGLCYRILGKLDLAVPLLEKTLKLAEAVQGPAHPHTLTTMNNLATSYDAAGKPELALPLYQEAAAALEKRDFQHHNAYGILSNLIGCLEQQKQSDEAEPWHRKWLAVVKRRSGADSLDAAGRLSALALNLLQQQKWTDAEAALRECIAIEAKRTPGAWHTFSAQAMLGEALLGQKKYKDAEPLLLEGYQGMQMRLAAIPMLHRDRLAETLKALVRLYDASDKDKAAKWRAALEQHEGTLVGTVRDVKEGLTLHGKLDGKATALVYEVKLSVGKLYVIEMVSPDQKALDPFLVLKYADGGYVAEDDDSGGGLNARIICRAPRSGVYRIHATSFNAGRGEFTLTVREKK